MYSLVVRGRHRQRRVPLGSPLQASKGKSETSGMLGGVQNVVGQEWLAAEIAKAAGESPADIAAKTAKATLQAALATGLSQQSAALVAAAILTSKQPAARRQLNYRLRQGA